MKKTNPTYYLILLLFCACSKEAPNTIFSKVSPRQSGIDFRNMLKETENFNIFKYQYFYNGGGLAVGDFNNDGLQDVIFTGNMVKNRLYINQGDMQFKDVTKTSGIATKEGWCTGVTTVDINEDGWLDLYICRAGFPFDDLRANLLFINNKDLTFTEAAAEYGLADKAYSTQSAFFDYDRDGDLDMFLLNHSTVEYSRGSLEIFQLKNKTNPDFTNKLYQNDGGKFTNITEATGISSNVLSFSLGLNISDINNDGWPDIFVGNDFNEPDYLFINQQNGTFKDELEQYFDHTSMFSMGSDIADFNNDGLLDLVSLDMLPESNFLQKMHSGVDNYDKVSLLEKKDFFRQYSRNMLQINHGDKSFSEVAQLSGVSNTDWSWTPLFFDFDNDGNKDLFIANGYLRDHTDMDFLNFTADEVMRIQKGEKNIGFEEYMTKMPPILQPNYFYQNMGDLQFKNQAAAWGIDEPSVSQSAAYVDLDNDGDLDLVVNNSGNVATLYQNNSEQLNNHNFLKIKLKGSPKNPTGIGAKVRLYTPSQSFVQEQYIVRGFQSSVDPNLNFGLGMMTKIDSLVVTWSSGEQQFLKNPKTNQILTLDIADATHTMNTKPANLATFFYKKDSLFQHQENEFNDFKTQSLLPYFYSREGAAMAVGDVNQDGLEDVFIGNAKGKSNTLLLQNQAGAFKSKSTTIFEKNAAAEALDAVFFDADGDQDLDLYVANGAYEFKKSSPDLQDQLYLNDGKGNFSKTQNQLPILYQNTTCVRPADIDNDGDMDLFLGGGVVGASFPQSYPNVLLVNDGKGHFSIQKNEALMLEGITKDAIWIDLNKDKFPELVLVGEWMPITIFENQKGQLINQTKQYLPAAASGLWQAIHAADFDGDGDQDLVLGNLGTNSQLHASATEPLEIFYDDYDNNGSIDPLICSYIQGQSYPLASRDDLLNQLPHLKKKFLYFKTYAEAQIDDILTSEQLNTTPKMAVTTLKSTYLEWDGAAFKMTDLPALCQFAPVRAIHAFDVNQDGHLDIILAGNMTHTRVRLGRLDGNHGQILLGNGQGDFEALNEELVGLDLKEETTNIKGIQQKGKPCLITSVNDGKVEIYGLNNSSK